MTNVNSNILTIGTCSGRHEMPVNEFIFNNAVEDVTDVESINNTVKSVLDSKMDGKDIIHLYVTGLTVLSMAVVKYCIDNNVNLVLYHFDMATKSYYSQVVI